LGARRRSVQEAGGKSAARYNVGNQNNAILFFIRIDNDEGADGIEESNKRTAGQIWRCRCP
jgi:hypothetical protein